MPLQVECPTCTKTYKLSQSFAGKKVSCKKCQAVFRVEDYIVIAKRSQTAVEPEVVPNKVIQAETVEPAVVPNKVDQAEAVEPEVVSPSVRIQPVRKTEKTSSNKNWVLIGGLSGGGVLLLATIIVGSLLVLNSGSSDRAKSTRLASQGKPVPAKSNTETKTDDKKERIGQKNNNTIDSKTTNSDDGKRDETVSNVPAGKNGVSDGPTVPENMPASAAQANQAPTKPGRQPILVKSNSEGKPDELKARVGQQDNSTIGPKTTHPDAGQQGENVSNVPAGKNEPPNGQMAPGDTSRPAAQANNVPPKQPAAPSSPNNYAFLVGVKQYPRTELTNLDYSEFDVTELSDVLRQSGYPDRNVELLTQAEGVKDINKLPTGTNIRYALELLLNGLKESDTVLIAFSGHGVQFAEDSTNYFCPMDASLSDQKSLISLESVFQQLEECGASGKLLLVDACRDDPQAELGKTGKRIQLAPIKSRRPPTLEGGTVALFSCSEGEQSFEDPKLKHGVFFHYVIRGMRGEADLLEDGNVTAQELETYVTTQVKDYARSELNQLQIPSHRGGSEVKGEIVLVSKFVPASSRLSASIFENSQNAQGLHPASGGQLPRHKNSTSWNTWGLFGQTVRGADAKNLDNPDGGVLLTDIYEGQSGGVQINDLIVEFDNAKVTNLAELNESTSYKSPDPGQVYQVKVVRNGKEIKTLIQPTSPPNTTDFYILNSIKMRDQVHHFRRGPSHRGSATTLRSRGGRLLFLDPRGSWVCDLTTGKDNMFHKINTEYENTVGDLSSDGKRALLYQLKTGEIFEWDIENDRKTTQLLNQPEKKTEQVIALFYLADDTQVVSVDKLAKVKIWDLKNKRLRKQFSLKEVIKGRTLSLKFDLFSISPDRSHLVHCNGDGGIFFSRKEEHYCEVISIETGQILGELVSARPIVHAKLSPDQTMMALFLENQDIEVWNLKSGAKVATLITPIDGDVDTDWSDLTWINNRFLATAVHHGLGGSPKRISIFDINEREPIREIWCQEWALNGLRYPIKLGPEKIGLDTRNNRLIAGNVDVRAFSIPQACGEIPSTQPTSLTIHPSLRPDATDNEGTASSANDSDSANDSEKPAKDTTTTSTSTWGDGKKIVRHENLTKETKETTHLDKQGKKTRYKLEDKQGLVEDTIYATDGTVLYSVKRQPSGELKSSLKQIFDLEISFSWIPHIGEYRIMELKVTNKSKVDLVYCKINCLLIDDAKNIIIGEDENFGRGDLATQIPRKRDVYFKATDVAKATQVEFRIQDARAELNGHSIRFSADDFTIKIIK